MTLKATNIADHPTIQVQIHVYQGEDDENRGYSEGLEGYSDSSQGMPDLEYRCCYKLLFC